MKIAIYELHASHAFIKRLVFTVQSQVESIQLLPTLAESGEEFPRPFVGLRSLESKSLPELRRADRP